MTELLDDLAARWRDTPEAHNALYQLCEARAYADPMLFEHRTYVAGHALGFGAMGLHWVWKALVGAVLSPVSPVRFLEIGVYRGQVLSLVGLLASTAAAAPAPGERRRWFDGRLVGVSTFDGRGLYGPGGEWTQPDPAAVDYQQLVELFYYCQLPLPTLVWGDSTQPATVALVRAVSTAFDIVYIDGSHAYDDVRADLMNYAPLVRPGGYLVMDDAACGFQMTGMYAGFPGPSTLCDSALPPFGGDTLPGAGGDGFSRWVHLFNVSHLRVWQRVTV